MKCQHILGEWNSGVTVLTAFLEELRIINELCNLMNLPPLFKQEFGEENRPKGFGFLIRPTLQEFNEFVLLFDKMISENLNRDFFRGDIDLEEEEIRKDGKVIVRPKGTLRLLKEWLELKFTARDETTANDLIEMIKTFKKIRKLRQKPAHSVNENVFEQEYFKQQRQLVKDAYIGVMTLRQVFQLHPYAKGYKIPEWLESGNIWTE